MAKIPDEFFSDLDFYVNPPPQYTEDLDSFCEELCDILNKYHLTIGGVFDLYLFSHHKSIVAEIQRYEGSFATINKIHEDKK